MSLLELRAPDLEASIAVLKLAACEVLFTACKPHSFEPIDRLSRPMKREELAERIGVPRVHEAPEAPMSAARWYGPC